MDVEVVACQAEVRWPIIPSTPATLRLRPAALITMSDTDIYVNRLWARWLALLRKNLSGRRPAGSPCLPLPVTLRALPCFPHRR